jgi:hypothetical protein
MRDIFEERGGVENRLESQGVWRVAVISFFKAEKWLTYEQFNVQNNKFFCLTTGRNSVNFIERSWSRCV